MLNLARLNLETAQTSPVNILNDCQRMYDEVVTDYNKYKDQMSILKLIEVYTSDVTNYEELLEKRNEINNIIKYIRNQELLNMISDMISKQFSTILIMI